MAAKKKAKFVQIAHVLKDCFVENLYALDADGDVWFRDVSYPTDDSEPWVKLNGERSDAVDVKKGKR